MKVMTSELSGAALDWAVGQADECDLAPVEYSTKWEFGGPIIERQEISLDGSNVACWRANGGWASDTPLIAAMRCYVASKLGAEVEIPKEMKP